jgi:hypothetical protein
MPKIDEGRSLMRVAGPNLRLSIAMAVALFGVIFQSTGLAVLGVAVVFLLLGLRMWPRASVTQGYLPIVGGLTLLPVGLVAGCVYFAIVRGGATFIILSVFALLPAGFLLFLAWAIAFGANTGRKAPGVEAFNRALRWSNRDISVRRRH